MRATSLLVILLAVVTVVFCVWSACFIQRTTIATADGARWHTLFDDAMISMRYAHNLAHGNGLVWNVGERVEGFTNPLMVLLMSVPASVLGRSSAVLAVQVMELLSLLVGACCLGIVGALHARPAARLAFTAVGVVSGLAYYPLAFWALEGMETGLIFALSMLALWRATVGAERPSWSFASLLVLLVATRPDASVQCAVLMLYRISLVPRARWLHLGLREGGALVVAAVAISLARHAYYGEWLPNTYVLKLTGLPLRVRLANGGAFIEAFLRQTWLPLLVVAAGVAWLRNRLVVVAVALLVSATTYQAWVGGDPWPYWRIMAPYVPLTFLATCFTAWRVGAGLAGSSSLGIGLGAFFWTAAVLIANYPFRLEASGRGRPYLVDENEKNLRKALELNRICLPGASLGVVAAGVIGYYTDFRVVDFLGKVDKRIARLPPDLHLGSNGMSSVPGHNKCDLQYSIVQLKPDYVQVATWGVQDVEQFVSNNYVRVGKLLLLKDSPHVRWDVLGNHGP